MKVFDSSEIRQTFAKHGLIFSARTGSWTIGNGSVYFDAWVDDKKWWVGSVQCSYGLSLSASRGSDCLKRLEAQRSELIAELQLHTKDPEHADIDARIAKHWHEIAKLKAAKVEVDKRKARQAKSHRQEAARLMALADELERQPKEIE